MLIRNRRRSIEWCNFGPRNSTLTSKRGSSSYAERIDACQTVRRFQCQQNANIKSIVRLWNHAWPLHTIHPNWGDSTPSQILNCEWLLKDQCYTNVSGYLNYVISFDLWAFKQLSIYCQGGAAGMRTTIRCDTRLSGLQQRYRNRLEVTFRHFIVTAMWYSRTGLVLIDQSQTNKGSDIQQNQRSQSNI
jgi:hypothetical protein